MAMKSMMANEHCSTLDRVFKIRRKHQLKLNSEKCSFDVQAGKFLGFMPTKRGIKANSKKFQAVMNMRSPESMKEVQQLAGRITTLSHFISRSTNTAIPIFNTLMKGDNVGNSSGSHMANSREWSLSIDEMSNQAGSRAKVILEGPNGVLIEQSVHFKLKANNNQVEYEALLVRMKLAQELKVRILTAKSDS
ncbi:Retrovirus-related Pol polyprotein from transposon opus, partial [Mucuna pruriens]